MRVFPFSWWARQRDESDSRKQSADNALGRVQHDAINRLNYLDARAEHYARFGFHAEDVVTPYHQRGGDAHDGGPPHVGAQ